MDQLINAGKQFMENQGNNNNNNNNQDNQQGGGNQGGGFDLGSIESLVSHAQNHDSNQDSGLLGQAASFLKQNQGNMSGDDVNENQLLQHADKVNNSDQSAHSSEIGNAAALNAIKSVLGGSGGGGGGDLQSKLIGAAMAQAGALFDQKNSNGQVSGGGKQDAMQSAGETAMKMMLKYKMSGMVGGGQGGLGSLMSMLN